MEFYTASQMSPFVNLIQHNKLIFWGTLHFLVLRRRHPHRMHWPTRTQLLCSTPGVLPPGTNCSIVVVTWPGFGFAKTLVQRSSRSCARTRRNTILSTGCENITPAKIMTLPATSKTDNVHVTFACEDDARPQDSKLLSFSGFSYCLAQRAPPSLRFLLLVLAVPEY